VASCEEGTTAMSLAACDVSGDEVCNSVDALFILQCDIGLVNLFCE